MMILRRRQEILFCWARFMTASGDVQEIDRAPHRPAPRQHSVRLHATGAAILLAEKDPEHGDRAQHGPRLFGCAEGSRSQPDTWSRSGRDRRPTAESEV